MTSIVLGITIFMIRATIEAKAQVNRTKSPLANSLLKGLGVAGKQCAFNSQRSVM